MTSKRVYFLMVGLLVLLFAAGGATVVYGQKTLKKQGDKLVELKLENHLLDEQQTAIKKANQDIEKYSDLEQTAKSIVPQDKDQAKVVRGIVAIAAKSKMAILSVSFPNSNLGSKGTATTPLAAQSAQLQISQAKPVTGLNGVYAVDMTIIPVGSYSSFISFLQGLENNRRTAQVNSVSIKPRANGSSISGYDFSLSLSIFIKPGATQ
jgi:hypothetical protein